MASHWARRAIDRLRRRQQQDLDLDDIQATILWPRPAEYFGSHALIEIADPKAGREALDIIRRRVTPASRTDHAEQAWTSVAITAAGLHALGVPADVIAGFPQNFREGMAARSFRLRDIGPNDPSNWEPMYRSRPVHLAVSVFATSPTVWKEEVQQYRDAALRLPGIREISHQRFGAQPDSRNPFGYRDGFIQPLVEGSPFGGFPGDGKVIKAGEFLLGYEAEGEVRLSQPLPGDLGRNGTYLVFRKYHSDVAAFNRYLAENADTDEAKELLAAKLVGRWRNGAPLALSPEHDDAELGADPHRNNDYNYHDDPRGLKTPLGSHVRRMNPRDTKLETLADVNIRRIIRRSTTYGEPLGSAQKDDGQARGIHFLAIGARAIDTVEFLQSEWVNSGNFVGRGAEKDPMLGVQTNGTFTIPAAPPKKMHGIEMFNTLRGGEYFFMPSLRALQWIAEGERRA